MSSLPNDDIPNELDFRFRFHFFLTRWLELILKMNVCSSMHCDQYSKGNGSLQLRFTGQIGSNQVNISKLLTNVIRYN